MGSREIADVHVIADRRAVGRIVIGAKYLDGGIPALRCCDDERNEVRFRRVVLADFAVGISPGRIEIAQIEAAPPVARIFKRIRRLLQPLKRSRRSTPPPWARATAAYSFDPRNIQRIPPLF